MTKPFSEYSMLDPNVASDPYEFYQALHEQNPVYQMPETGAYVVTRYDDLRQVLRDYETFSSDVNAGGMGEHRDLLQSILQERGWRHVQTLQQVSDGAEDEPEEQSVDQLRLRAQQFARP